MCIRDRVEGYALEIQKYHNIHVVYTKEAETADQYIEKVVHHIGRKYHVTVVTSDEMCIRDSHGGADQFFRSGIFNNGIQ